MVRWLTDLFDRVKSDQFDPHSLVREVQELQRQLFEERAKRSQLEDDMEHVKRGSIAVIQVPPEPEARSRDQAIQTKDAEIAELKLKILTQGPDSDGTVLAPAQRTRGGVPSRRPRGTGKRQGRRASDPGGASGPGDPVQRARDGTPPPHRPAGGGDPKPACRSGRRPAAGGASAAWSSSPRTSRR